MLDLMRYASHDVHRENIFVVLGRLDITGGRRLSQDSCGDDFLVADDLKTRNDNIIINNHNNRAENMYC